MDLDPFITFYEGLIQSGRQQCRHSGLDIRECMFLSEAHFIRVETRFRLCGYFWIMYHISTPVNGKHVGQSWDSGVPVAKLVARILSNLISYLIPSRPSRPLKKRNELGLYGQRLRRLLQCPALLLQSLQRYPRTWWNAMCLYRRSLRRIRGRDMIDTCIIIRKALRVRSAINSERHSILHHESS